jgi:hypothetical protein
MLTKHFLRTGVHIQLGYLVYPPLDDFALLYLGSLCENVDECLPSMTTEKLRNRRGGDDVTRPEHANASGNGRNKGKADRRHLILTFFPTTTTTTTPNPPPQTTIDMPGTPPSPVV